MKTILLFLSIFISTNYVPTTGARVKFALIMYWYVKVKALKCTIAMNAVYYPIGHQVLKITKWEAIKMGPRACKINPSYTFFGMYRNK